MTDLRMINKSWHDLQFGPMWTQRDLIARGWTKATIQKLLGEPDCYGRNPLGGAPVLLYSQERARRAKILAAGYE